jgi:secreted PhoX family phosphatase
MRQRKTTTPRIDRRTFLRRSAALGAGLAALGPLHALGVQAAQGQAPARVRGYGPLVPKGDLALPAAFNYTIISRQGQPMSDGHPTPGIFDAMAAYPTQTADGRTATILIRNHENRERPGEIPVVVPEALAYDYPATIAGNTKLVVQRDADGLPFVVESFAVLGGTSTNCAGGVTPWHSWLACEEVVKRTGTGKKHGYVFEINASTTGPVAAVPIRAAGRFVHEAAVWHAGSLYQTEDRSLQSDLVLGEIGACFYQYLPDRPVDRAGILAQTNGRLEALKLKNEVHANMDIGRVVGQSYPVEWVPVPEPDHDDDTDNRRDRQPGVTPTRIQAQDRGAAYFDRQEGMWVGGDNIYFDCTTGGAQNLGQVWEYDPIHEHITLIYESTNAVHLQNPDNMVLVPQTGDIFLCEDSPGEQYIRGLTSDGAIYDFARTITNDSEFCGACFDPDGQILYVNQQGERGGPAEGPPGGDARTYAIWGPFEARQRHVVFVPHVAKDS